MAYRPFSKQEKQDYAKRMKAIDMAAALIMSAKDDENDDEAMDILRDMVDGNFGGYDD